MVVLLDRSVPDLPHPLDRYTSPSASGAPIIPSSALRAHVGRRIAIAGIVVATRRIRTTRGDPMLFFSLADRVGVVEVTVFARQVAQLEDQVRYGTAIVVTGTVTNYAERGLGLDAQALVPVGEPLSGQEPPPTDAEDFGLLYDGLG